MTQELPQNQTGDDFERKNVSKRYNNESEHSCVAKEQPTGAMMVDTDLTTTLKSPCVFVQKNLCKACGLCIAFCPKKVLSKGFGISEMGYEFTVYAGEGCIGCGTCFYVCPEPGAITVVKRSFS
ncbi:MAG: 4Fe-4S dicluster domain-containing protein [Planctomycetaceae bacterium]|nr:4Fe-4S dicluster domain-containing protein [Planctomycetaceae bacterium]